MNTSGILWRASYDPVTASISRILSEGFRSMGWLFSFTLEIRLYNRWAPLSTVIIHIVSVLHGEEDSLTYKIMELRGEIQEHHDYIVFQCLVIYYNSTPTLTAYANFFLRYWIVYVYLAMWVKFVLRSEFKFWNFFRFLDLTTNYIQSFYFRKAWCLRWHNLFVFIYLFGYFRILVAHFVI